MVGTFIVDNEDVTIEVAQVGDVDDAGAAMDADIESISTLPCSEDSVRM